MNFHKKGEVATILTIAAFVFIGVASLTSSFFLNKPQTTASSAQLRTPAFSGSESPGGGCSNTGEWRVQCTNNRGPCGTGEGVAMPYQCTNGVWTLTNPSGECNATCAVGSSTNTGSQNTGGNPYGVYIDGPGRTCGPSKGGANNLGCGGDDGCRFWEVCQNGACLDTTNNGQSQPGSNACGGDAGSRDIWTEAQIAQYNSTNTGTTGGNQQTGSASCVINGNFSYPHGTRYCTGGGDVGQCLNGQLTTYNDCHPNLPCNPNTLNCATSPSNGGTTVSISPSAPPNVSPSQSSSQTQTGQRSCTVLGRPIAHGERFCNAGDVMECQDSSVARLVDCPDALACDPSTKRCATVASLTPNCNVGGNQLNSGQSVCFRGAIHTCNGSSTNITECSSRMCNPDTNQCVTKLTSGTENGPCSTRGETLQGDTLYIMCNSGLQCSDDNGDGIGLCKRSSFFPVPQRNQTSVCTPGVINGVKYYYKTTESNQSQYFLGAACTGTIYTYAELTAMTLRINRYKFTKTSACEASCQQIGKRQLGINSSTNLCTCE